MSHARGRLRGMERPFSAFPAEGGGELSTGYRLMKTGSTGSAPALCPFCATSGRVCLAGALEALEICFSDRGTGMGFQEPAREWIA